MNHRITFTHAEQTELNYTLKDAIEATNVLLKAKSISPQYLPRVSAHANMNERITLLQLNDWTLRNVIHAEAASRGWN
jgi:hypothetical protein